MWYNILTPKYKEKSYLQRLNNFFLEHHYVILDDFFPENLNQFFVESKERLSKYVANRDFIMEEFQSKRCMNVISASSILKNEPGLWFLYRNIELIRVLETITGQKIYPSEYEYLWCVYNILEGKGQTQGWHIDDEAFVMIHMLDENTSSLQKGGALCLIYDWHEFVLSKAKDGITDLSDLYHIAKCENRIKEIYIEKYQTLILRGDKVMHQVSELPFEDSSRINITFSWQHAPVITHDETSNKIYNSEY